MYSVGIRSIVERTRSKRWTWRQDCTSQYFCQSPVSSNNRVSQHTWEITVRKKKTQRDITLVQVSQWQRCPKAVLWLCYSLCVFELSCSHRSHSSLFFCKCRAGHLPCTMNMWSPLKPYGRAHAYLTLLPCSEALPQWELGLSNIRSAEFPAYCHQASQLQSRYHAHSMGPCFIHLVHSQTSPPHSSMYRALSCCYIPMPSLRGLWTNSLVQYLSVCLSLSPPASDSPQGRLHYHNTCPGHNV